MSKKITGIIVLMVLSIFIMGYAMGAVAGDETVTQTVNNHNLGYYTVIEGDSLYRIAERTGVSTSSLIRTNKLSSTTIYPKQVLVIPGKNPNFDIAISRGFTREETLLLAKAIYAEARGESFTGQVAVGAVILNRLEHSDFPKTIKDVIMQNKGGNYQFSPVADGSINMDPDDVAVCAAIQAIQGLDPTNGALYFYNPDTANDQWIRGLPVNTRIGNHVFATNI